MSVSNPISNEKLLRDVIEKAAYASIDRNEKIVLNGALFVRSFLRYWLYNEDQEELAEPTNAFGSFVLLLHKNISVTNVTHPEISALLRIHSTDGTTRSFGASPIEFFSNRQYRSYVERTLPNVDKKQFDTEDSFLFYVKEISDRIVNYMADFLLQTIAVTSYATSCVVHIPRSLRINLCSVVSQSGYIHSAGYQIYVAKSESSNASHLSNNLTEIYRKGKFNRPLFFATYSQEFFAGEEGETAYSMKNGLDGVKLAARKHFIGNENLLDFVSELSPDMYLIPRTEKFATEREEFRGRVEDGYSVFLIIDVGLEYSKTQRTLRRSDELYTLCYLQFAKSSNKLSIIKERKPGWTGPITIPHTLSAALINVARRNLQLINCEKPLILDPFCGTSTFLIDAAIRIPEARLIGIDRHPLFELINRDNLEFLANKSRSKRLIDFAQLALNQLDGLPQAANARLDKGREKLLDLNALCGDDAAPKNTLATALALIVSEIAVSQGIETKEIDNSSVKDFRDDESHFGTELLKALDAWTNTVGRYCFYSMWRAISTFSYRLESADSQLEWLKTCIERVIRPELDRLQLELRDIDQIDELLPTGGSFQELIASDQHISTCFEEVDGLYSREHRISTGALGQVLGSRRISYHDKASFLSELARVRECNGLKLVSGDSVEVLRSMLADGHFADTLRPNLIITDPPYNFNVLEGDDRDMQDLFVNIVELIPKIIAPKGIAIIVVPSFSRNGQSIPFYQSNEVFTRRMFAACARSGRRLILLPETQPSSITFPQLPYKWNSARGVSRFIMVFMVE